MELLVYLAKLACYFLELSEIKLPYCRAKYDLILGCVRR